MQLFPTIHIKNGRCYSTVSVGETGRYNIYTSNPAKLAALWESKGAKRLHVVDVDGAMTGEPMNKDAVREILQTVSVPVQCGGGLRTVRDIDEYLNIGVDRVVCGTMPIQKHRFAQDAIELFGPDRFVVGIDVNNGMVVVEGREKMYEYNPVTLIHKLREYGVSNVIYTDIGSPVSMEDRHLENIKALIAHTDINIITAGGISNANDIRILQNAGVQGVIIATALYDGRISLEDIISEFE